MNLFRFLLFHKEQKYTFRGNRDIPDFTQFVNNLVTNMKDGQVTFFILKILFFTIFLLKVIFINAQDNAFCILPFALCTLHFVLCTLYFAHFTLHTALCTLHHLIVFFLIMETFFYEKQTWCYSILLLKEDSLPKHKESNTFNNIPIRNLKENIDIDITSTSNY